MKIPTQYVCPRCDYELVPVHSLDGRRRRVVALSCPEPYCDHVQLVSRDEADRLERAGGSGPEGAPIQRAAN